MRHFEKKGKMRLFRRVGTRGARLELEVGMASERTTRVVERFESERAAERAALAWARWSLDAGYAEVFYDKGQAGIVRTLEGPSGPGRVRTDEPEDVYFAAGAAVPEALEIGERVLVEGVRKKKGLAVSFMFGSELVAKRVVAFPEPRWSEWRASPDLPEKTRRALLALAGERIMGCREAGRPLRAVRAGALIFHYYKGVHRFLKRERGGMVLSESVLTSQLTRQSAPVDSCLDVFCEPVPARLRVELEKRLGLGLATARAAVD